MTIRLSTALRAHDRRATGRPRLLRPCGSQASPAPLTAPLPPQNLDAEESVLGAMMLSPARSRPSARSLGDRLLPRVAREDLPRRARALRAGEPVDAITVADELDERGELEEVGGRFASTSSRARPGRRERGALREDRARDGDAARPHGAGSRSSGSAGTGPARRPTSSTGPSRWCSTSPSPASGQLLAHRGADQRELRADHGRSTSRAARSPARRPASARSTTSPRASARQPVIVAARPSMGKSAFALGVAANLAVGTRSRSRCSRSRCRSSRWRSG